MQIIEPARFLVQLFTTWISRLARIPPPHFLFGWEYFWRLWGAILKLSPAWWQVDTVGDNGVTLAWLAYKKSAAWYMSRAHKVLEGKEGVFLFTRTQTGMCTSLRIKRIFCFALHDLWFSCFKGGFLCVKRYTRMSGIWHLHDYLSCSCYPALRDCSWIQSSLVAFYT